MRSNESIIARTSRFGPIGRGGMGRTHGRAAVTAGV
jgi:hypothetical protein